MSKRGAEGQGGEERYGSWDSGNAAMDDKPKAATAAQMAKRKIASIKRGGKARSASPLTGPSTTFTPPNTFTTTPSSFSFGAQQQSSNSFAFGQQQPSDGNGMDRIEQSSTPAPAASSFTFGQSQPQPPSSNGFGQQNSNPFAGFGQQNAAPTGGAQTTPSFSFGAQQSSTTGNANSNPFGGFGQQTQTSNAPSTTFSFGAQSQSASPAPTNPFSGFNSQPSQNGTPAPSNSFTFGAQPSNSQPSANGTTTPSFSFGASQPAQAPAPQTTSSLFAPQQSTEQKSPSPFQGSNSMFSKPAEAPKADGWASFKSASPAATPGGEATGASVLSGWQKEQTSKPTFSFSASQMPTGDVDDDDTMASPEKPTPAQPVSAFGGGSNLFGTSQSAAPAGNDLFSRISKPAETNTASTEQPANSTATPKAPTSSGSDLFGRVTFPDKANDQTISATPAPKASNPFSGFSVAPPATAPAKNLFSGASNEFGIPSTPTPAAEKAPEAPATVKPAQSFSTSSLFSAATPKAPTANSLFAPKPAVEEAPEVSATPKPAPSSTSSLFSSSTPKQPAASLFTPAPAQGTGFTSSNSFQPSPQPQTVKKATASNTNSTFDTTGASEMRQLNEGFMQRLSAADPDADYSQLLKFYLKKVKAINGSKGKNDKKPEGTSFTQTPKPAASKSLFERTPSTASQNGTGFGQSNGTASKPRQAGEPNGVDLTKSLFGSRSSEAQTPKPSFTNGLFGRVPATEPKQGAVKRSIEDDGNNVPQTEFKHRKSKETVDYPKLPAGASNTAKLFEAALDKPAESGAAAKSLFTPKPTATETSAGEQTPKAPTFGAFKPSTSSLFTPAKKDADTPQTSGNGVAASSSLFTPKPAPKAEMPKPAMPKPAVAGGFMPTFAAPPAGGNNFLSAFGANASKEQDQARKKAMDEDFDSEDDDPEEWKKQYEEKQAAKRKAIEEAAKSGGGFMMKPVTPKPAAKEQEKQDSTPAAGENNTWKQGTPIKFGTQDKTPAVPATAPPAKSGGLFAGNTGSSLFANMGSQTPQPSSGSSLFSQTKPAQTNGASLFSFTKPADNSAPKPAEPAQSNTEATANGAGNDDDEEAANDPQVEDMTALQPAEQEESDIVYHIEKAKSYKSEVKTEGGKPEWVYKALGPVWLLRNKTTGKTRVLQKVAPLGKAGVNFNVLKSAAMYAQQNKRVTATFIDHINEKDPKKPSQWFVQCGKEEDAKELARLLKEEAEKQ